MIIIIHTHTHAYIYKYYIIHLLGALNVPGGSFNPLFSKKPGASLLFNNVVLPKALLFNKYYIWTVWATRLHNVGGSSWRIVCVIYIYTHPYPRMCIYIYMVLFLYLYKYILCICTYNHVYIYIYARHVDIKRRCWGKRQRYPGLR